MMDAEKGVSNQDMTNEEAIKHLRDVFYADLTQEQREAVYVAVAALERDRWISVGEQWPEDGEKIELVTPKGTMFIGVFMLEVTDNLNRRRCPMPNRGKPRAWTEYGYRAFKAWRPLPEPPKEET